MEQLKVAEYAELRGVTVQYVRQLISKGQLQATISFGSGGASGRGYLIPLAAIEPKLQKKYMRIHREKFPEPEMKPMAVKCLEDLSFEERQEVNRWKEIWYYVKKKYKLNGGCKKSCVYGEIIFSDMSQICRNLLSNIATFMLSNFFSDNSIANLLHPIHVF